MVIIPRSLNNCVPFIEMYVLAYLLRRVDDVKISATKLNGVLQKWMDHV